MEQDIYNCLQRIALYNDILDKKYINIEIGIYRLNALKYRGLIKHLINMDANKVERELRKAIDEYHFQTSSR